MRTDETVHHAGEGMMNFKKRFFSKKAWRKRFKKLKKMFKKLSHKIATTSTASLVVYGFVLLGVLLIISSIAGMITSQKSSDKVYAPYAKSNIVDYYAKVAVPADHVDPGLADVAGKYKLKPSTSDSTPTVDTTVKETLIYPELSSVTLVSGLTLPVPVTWAPVAAAGTDLSFSRGTPDVVISFSDLGNLKEISQGILDSTKKTLETQGSIVSLFKTSDKGVVSFTASQGDRNVEVYLMVVGGRGLMVNLTYDGKANSASSEVAWLVDKITGNVSVKQ